MKSKVKLGLIIVSALIFSASFGFVVGRIIKDREAEKAFLNLSEELTETQPESSLDETEVTESCFSEETSEIFSSETEEVFLIPVIQKPYRTTNKTQPEPVEESEPAASEETTTNSPSSGGTEPESTVPTEILKASQPTRETLATPTAASSSYYKGIRNCVGWLRIDGTAINYPVMQSKDDPEFYLHHAISGEYSYPGVPFLDARCDIGVSNQLIIYGHNMRNGTMFHDLRYYSSYSYWQSHRYICLDTVCGPSKYEVMAVIQYDVDHDSFRFNAFTEMDADTFVWFVQQVHVRHVYETNVTASFGDELLTLSTCDWTYTNGRLLVIARRIPS
ncbi:MAG: class B sortase [Firmicutes bacterium]|nr:class B sortase [Bacillota bacterium]